MAEPMKIMAEVSRTEIDNLQFFRSRGLGDVKVSDIFTMFDDDWCFCNKPCKDCGAHQFYKDGSVKCLTCGDPE